MSIYVLRLIPFVVFSFLLYLSYLKGNRLSMSIIFLYVITSFSSLFISRTDLTFHDFQSDRISHFVLYTLIHSLFLLLTFFLKPISNLNLLPSGRLYDFILLFFSLGSVFSIVYLTPYAIISFGRSAFDVRTSLTDEYVLPSSYLTTLAVGFPTFYYVYTFMFYVSLIRRQKLIMFLSALGVLGFVVNVLTISGRDGVFLATFSFVLGYFYFEPLLDGKLKLRIKRYFIGLIILSLIPIFKITVDRFSETGDFTFSAFYRGIVIYLGVQPFVFSDWLKDNSIFNGGVNDFSLLVFGDPIKYTEPYTWNFGTYLTSFYAVSGYFSLILISLVFYLFFRRVLVYQNRYSILALFFFLGLYFHFMISGVFYFRLGTSGGNLYIFLSILMILIFKKTYKLKWG